jgi:hypothetical protein
MASQRPFATYRDYTVVPGGSHGPITTPTGFMEFQPRDPIAQAKYSATSPGWEGIASSEAAIARGDYDLDRAEVKRLKPQVPPPPVLPPPPPPPSWNCSIQ